MHAAAQLGGRAFVREPGDGALHHAPADLGGCVHRTVGDFRPAIAHRVPPCLARRPFERRFGITEVRCAGRERLRIEPSRLTKRAADADAFEPLVLVARIARGFDARSLANCRKLAPTP